MHQQPAYNITHVYLDRQQTPPLIDYMLTGNYLVFWWKGIALGHFTVKPGGQLTDEVYYSKLIEAIQPAVHFYTAKEPQENCNWQQLLQDRDLENWTRWMEHIFSSWTPNNIPTNVPVSVIICTRNRATSLKHCLQHLLRLSCLPEEIIVVDNAPSDNTTQLAVAQFEKVIYIKEPRPGLDIARNTGYLKASSPIIAYTDDDVLIHPMWVYWVWRTFQDTSVAAMTGLVIAAELQTKAQVEFERYWSFNRGYIDKIYADDFFSSTLSMGPPVWEIGAGANMAFRKSVFKEVGPFNELLDVGAAGCNGDSEMWYRILAYGGTIYYNPRAIVYHKHRREMEGLKNQIYNYMRGFTVAALLQQKQHKKAGYKKHMREVMIPFYSELLREGFPHYRSRSSTVWAEVRGILSGLLFYMRYYNKLTKSLKK